MVGGLSNIEKGRHFRVLQTVRCVLAPTAGG